MWADAALWLPRALGGEFVEATFEIGQADQVVSQQMAWMARESA
jgi:8-oxo-dGTP diphosphatase